MKANNARTRKHSSVLNQQWYMPKLIFEALKYAALWSGLAYISLISLGDKSRDFQLYILLSLTNKG
jgi:hypothetical protein